MDLIVRDIESSEIPKIVDLFAAEQTSPPRKNITIRKNIAKRWEGYFKLGKTLPFHLVGAFDQQALIGLINYRVDEEPKRGEITLLETHREFKRRGVATALFQHAVKHLKEIGCSRLNVQTLTDIEGPHFYEYMGGDRAIEHGTRLVRYSWDI